MQSISFCPSPRLSPKAIFRNNAIFARVISTISKSQRAISSRVISMSRAIFARVISRAKAILLGLRLLAISAIIISAKVIFKFYGFF